MQVVKPTKRAEAKRACWQESNATKPVLCPSSMPCTLGTCCARRGPPLCLLACRPG